MFQSVDKIWRDIMQRTREMTNVMRAAGLAGLLETLQQANTTLEKIQKCLEEYLETKRLVFPRFYFLSNEELFEIMSQV